MIRNVLLTVAILAMAASTTGRAQAPAVVEIDVKGLSCSFCVYAISRSLSKEPNVAKVDVSLKDKKARIVLEPGVTPDVDRYKRVIVESGFTPGDARIETAARQ